MKSADAYVTFKHHLFLTTQI